MKKLGLILTLGLVSSVVNAVSVTVTIDAFNTIPALYDHDGNALAYGNYAELITKNNDSTYSDSEKASWNILATLGTQVAAGSTYTVNYATVGKSATGTSLGSGNIVFKWRNTGYGITDYVAIRFYDAVTKSGAKWYGVTTPTILTKTGNTAAGAPLTETIAWKTTTNPLVNRFTAQYAVPEPATMALFGLGGLALVIRKKMKKEV